MNYFIRACMLLIAGLLYTPAPILAQEAGVPQMSVSGQVEMRVAPDRLRLSIGVVTQAATAEQALQENNRRIRAVTAALREAGLGEDEMATGQFRVEPRWSSRPPRPETEWEPKIVGYTVTNSLDLKTTRLPLAGKLIAAAGVAGANQIGALEFDLADPQQHRAEAIRGATANARADAAALAQAAGVRLVRVLSLNLDQPPSAPMRIGMERYAMKAMADEPVIAPGEVTVRAGVNLVYEVAPE
ncbi:MAG: SIMPL domain-containing protein [Desulfuromonadales bacterium]